MTTTMPYFTNGKFGSGPAPEGFDGEWETVSPPGYMPVESLGIGAAPVTVLHAQGDTSQPGPVWMIELSDGSSTEYIGVNSLREVMDLTARWAPVATASILSYFCEILAGPDDITDSTLARFIGRIRADDREGITDQATEDILDARRTQRQAWMADQASPAQTANGAGPGEPAVVSGSAEVTGQGEAAG